MLNHLAQVDLFPLCARCCILGDSGLSGTPSLPRAPPPPPDLNKPSFLKVTSAGTKSCTEGRPPRRRGPAYSGAGRLQARGDLAQSPCCVPHDAQGKLPGRKNSGSGKPRDYWTGVNPASATSHGAYVVPGSREAEGQALRAIPILAVQECRRGFFRSR